MKETCTASRNLFFYNDIFWWNVMPCSLIGIEQVARKLIITYLPELRDLPAIKKYNIL
jgi:hypothetical protein